MHIPRLILCSLFLLAPQLSAAEDAPVTYQKERLVLKPSEPTSVQYEDGVLVDVDVINAGSQINNDWLQLTGYKNGTGLLEVYTTSRTLGIAPTSMMAASDIIAMDAYGKVVMIAPNLVLGTLQSPIERSEMVKAILYTSAGFSETIGLKIGDHVEYKSFQKAPVVVDTSTKTAEVATEVNTQEAIPTASEQPVIEATNLQSSAAASAEAKTADDLAKLAPLSDRPARRKPIENPALTNTIKE